MIKQGFCYFAQSGNPKIHVIHENMQNTMKFTRNLIKYMSVQRI